MQQRTHPGAGLGEQATVLDEDAVFTHERDDVGHGGECDQIEQMVRQISRKLEHGHEGLDQLRMRRPCRTARGAGGIAARCGST